MSILTTALKAILISLALSLSLSACSAGVPANAPTATAGSAVSEASAADATTLALKKYKMTTVKKHKTAASCWTVVGKGVYNLTKFISRHPGGRSRIIALCGKNGTTAFRHMHGSTGRAVQVLATYRIGKLA